MNFKEHLYNLATDRYRGFIPAVIKAFLLILSLIYASLVRILIFFCRTKSYRLDCKVVSVGNITLGGTGKTTLVEFIARYLKEKGHKVAILSRGYKKKITSYQLPVTSYENIGDEPYMLKMNLKEVPVIVDSNRIRAAKLAIRKFRADTVILDDGFQQWGISKDLEIVAIDATRAFGNRQMIPRGILREPLSSLKRADIFVFTKTNLNPDIQKIKDFLMRLNPQAVLLESIHQPAGFYKINRKDELLRTDLFRGKTVTLISGIGDPQSFENLIKSLSINVGLSYRFCDHYNYAQKDLDDIIKASKNKKIDSIITTEKDAVRLLSLPFNALALPIFVLRIELVIAKNESEFHNRLLGLYSL